MNDEVKQAAARLRRIANGERVTAIYEHPKVSAIKGQRSMFAVGQRQKDQKALADAYLAEHPADDGELVDLDWLQSCYGGEAIDEEITMLEHPSGQQIFVWSDGTVNFDNLDCRISMTRRQFDLLCISLRIPITESEARDE